MNEEKFEEIRQGTANLAAVWLQMAQSANDIAFARRRMYEAYVLEGFTPHEALELCKVL